MISCNDTIPRFMVPLSLDLRGSHGRRILTFLMFDFVVKRLQKTGDLLALGELPGDESGFVGHRLAFLRKR